MNKGNYKFLNATEFAKLLKQKREINFTFDDKDFIQEPTGWYGIKFTNLFNEPFGTYLMGDYGASFSMCFSPENNSIEELANGIQEMWDNETGYNVECVCCEAVNIKELREKKNMSMFELASKANVSPTGLSRIESGVWNPKQEILDRIYEVLNN